MVLCWRNTLLFPQRRLGLPRSRVGGAADTPAPEVISQQSATLVMPSRRLRRISRLHSRILDEL